MISLWQPYMDLYHLQSGSMTWIISLNNHDIHFNEVCCPFPRWSVLVVNCTVYPGVVVTWLLWTLRLFWHLLEVNWVHYLIAISTSGFRPVFLHANSKQTQAPNKYGHRKRQITYIYVFFSTSTPSSNRSLLSSRSCQSMWVFFFSTGDLTGFHGP